MTIAEAAKRPHSARGRPSGRSRYQMEQRRTTREAIVAAAFKIFGSIPYIAATVDDLIREAGVSRATFYAHFASKLDLAIAVYEVINADGTRIFEKLTPAVAGNDGKLRRWVRELADVYVEHGLVTNMVAQMTLLEEGFPGRLRRDRQAIIDLLANAGLPGFVAANGPGRAGREQSVRGHLLLRSLDQICAGLARPESDEADREITIRLIARELGRFADPAA